MPLTKEQPTDEMLQFGGKDPELLKRFMQEFFPYSQFKKIGIFRKEMRNNYYEQAACICNMLGYKSIYEYGAEEIRCHISYGDGKRPDGEGFVTVIPSIYE